MLKYLPYAVAGTVLSFLVGLALGNGLQNSALFAVIGFFGTILMVGLFTGFKD